MTETRFTWRWLLVIALVGIFLGLAVGLAAGWILFPNIGGSSVAGLAPDAQNDYIVLVANTYVYDRDSARAKQRLAELNDKNIKTRLERLAKSYALRQDPAAANLADLAIELGSDDSSLMVMAQQVSNVPQPSGSDAEPTKIARGSGANTSAEQPTPTLKPPTAKPTRVKKTQAPAVAATDIPEPTQAPTKAAPKATSVPKPTDIPPTAAPQAPPVTTEFIPGFPGGWWDAVKFVPAQVAPGQPYWHLKYARYCDWAPDDNHQTCEGFPGGGMGTSIYIMTVDEGGNCITTDVNDDINDGSKYPLTTDALKKIEYAWNPYGFACDQNYEKGMYGEGNTISVPGLPSDKITELSLCAKNPPAGYNPPPCGHAHVRYFLIFQRTTR